MGKPDDLKRPPEGPLVSIVIDNFNYARYLPLSIESALAQTWPRTEVIVVDDASSDGSAAVIARYADRVTAVLQPTNGGQAAALNAGFAASRGDIVLFLDADDYLHPHAVERVVAAWRPGTTKAQFRLDLVDAMGRRIDLFPAPEVRFDSGDVVPRLLATGRYETTVTSGNAFAREVLERILPIPEEDFRVSADGYLVTVAPLFGPVVSIEEPLGAYRLHGQNRWAAGGGTPLPDRLRRSLAHDERKYRALVERAGALGLEPRAALGMRDHQHLETRLASLCLDPGRHPYPGDSRLRLALRGAIWAWTARLSWPRRAILSAWFLAAGVLPRPMAARVIAWKLSPDSRRPPVARLLRAVRRAAH